jgi:cytochrome c
MKLKEYLAGERSPWPMIINLLILCSVFSCDDTKTIDTGTFTANPGYGSKAVHPDSSEWSTGADSNFTNYIPNDWPATFGFGATASVSEIKKMDIDIMPDGRGLPNGNGQAQIGRQLYALKCAVCHGQTGREGPSNKLVGSFSDTTSEKTIGNYWPYSTTLFDYIRRTMPLNAPGSLSNEEVYNLTAYLLAANKIIDSTTVINATSLPAITMPARKLFITDDRRGGKEVK